jgi:DNA-binding NarL/FixJ family response regulator
MMDEPTDAAPAEISKPIKTAIVEDQPKIRDGLASLLEFAGGFTCTGSYRSMEECLARISFNVPDVVLSDIGLPGMNGIEGVKILKEKYPDLTILMLTVYNDDERIFDAICAGAGGYLLKRTPPTKLLENIREAVEGGSPMSPEVASRVLKLFRVIRPPERVEYDLTPHETRLLKLLVEGYNYKTAAKELKNSTNTIKFYIKRIYEKLQVHSRSEAVAKALRERIIE